MPEQVDAQGNLKVPAKGCIQVQAQGCIKLSGVVDVDTVAGYREELQEMIGSNASHKLEIDLGELEIHGTAVIALLISVVRESRKIPKEVFFKNSPENLLAVARACGVAGILKLDSLV